MRLQDFHYNLNQKIIREIKNIQGNDPPQIRRYKKNYSKEFKTTSKSTWEALLDSCHQHQFILLGDFHVSSQSQRTLLRIIRELQITEFVLALEYFNDDENPLLASYLNNEITLNTLEKRIASKANRLSPFKNYVDILEFAKNHKILIRGINFPNLAIFERDKLIALKLARLEKPAFCLIGNYHLIDANLPSQLHKIHPFGRTLKIFQNNEDLWWKQPKKNLTHDVYRLEPKHFCIQSIPPWIINQSYLDYLSEEEEELDNFSHLSSLMKTFEALLSLKTINLENLNVQVFEKFSLNATFSKEIQQSILHSTAFYDGKNLFLPSLRLNHLSDGIGKIIYHHCVEKKSSDLKTIESFAFFVSLLINPKRKSPEIKTKNAHPITFGKALGAKLFLEYSSREVVLKKFLKEKFNL